jgi:putative PIN family toxin of toxin-antitoxin system
MRDIAQKYLCIKFTQHEYMNAPRVVLDTNILVSAILSPLGNPAKVYKMFLTWTLDLIFSADILAEYEDVLSRPRLHIPANEAVTVLAAIRCFGERIEPVPSGCHD